MLDRVAADALSVRTSPEGFREARAWVTRFARVVGFPEETARHLALAVSEACANAYRHAYARTAVGRVDLNAQIDAAGLRITVRDYGRSFDPSTYRPPVMDELPESGFGIHLMRLLTDEVRHVNEGDGTRVVMFKRLPTGSVANDRVEKVMAREAREGS
jgi:serine/threonine-protein kinase RsbW